MHTNSETAGIACLEALNRFLEGSWDLTVDLRLGAGDPLTERIDKNWRQFRLAVLNALVEQEEITVQSSAAAARNSVRTRDIQGRMQAMQDGMRRSVESLASVSDGARQAATAVARSAELVGQAREATHRTHESASAMATSVAEIAAMLSQVSAQLDSLAAQSKQVGDLSKVVRGVAQQVNLLSLNASIEAARAGAHGRTFAVVAQEVRKLADHTAKQASDIDGVIKVVVDQVRQADDSMETGLARTRQLAEAARVASDAAGAIDDLVTEIASPFTQLTATMQEHTRTLSQVSFEVEGMARETGAVNNHVNVVAAESSTLLDLTHQAQKDLTYFYKGSFIDQIKRSTVTLAAELEQVLTAAVDQGRVSLDDVLALDYTEIKGADIRDLSRLFDVSRAPASGFAPPKFRTRYDSKIDIPLQQVLDRFLQAQGSAFFTGLMDLNGYMPTSNAATCKAWTGDFRTDVQANRLKRFITDGAQLHAAQVGLKRPSFSSLSTADYVRDPRTVLSRSEFLRLGNSLRREDDPPGLFTLYTYASVSGRVSSICSVPVYVKGHRYGAAMIGWEPKVGKK